MNKSILTFFAAGLLSAPMAFGDVTFSNGNFETGTLNGWTLKAWNPGSITIPDTNVLTSVTNTNPYWGTNGNTTHRINTGGTDVHTGIDLTYNGKSAQIGDDRYWGGYAYQFSSISQTQTVAGPSAGNLYFAWAAILEESNHTSTSTPFFQVLVTKNKGLAGEAVVYNVQHYEDLLSPPGTWVDTGSWLYHAGNTPTKPGWQVENLDLAALGIGVGDTVTLEAIARDCDPTGHAMYVLLDGFSAAPPPPSGVPDAGSSLLLVTLGIGALAGIRRRK